MQAQPRSFGLRVFLGVEVHDAVADAGDRSISEHANVERDGFSILLPHRPLHRSAAAAACRAGAGGEAHEKNGG